MTEWMSSIGPAVGNHLWQSTAFAAVAWLATLLLRRNQARVRYGLWLAASVKFLVPFSLLVGLGSLLPKPQHVVVAMPVSYAMDTVAQPFTETPMDFAPVVVQPSPMQRVEHLVPLALGIIWLCGVMAVLAVWGVRWRQVAKTLRLAVRVEDGREWEIIRRLHKAMGAGSQIPLMMSQKLMEPGMFGIFRPVLIWPERLSERLDDEHIEAILAHELRHAQRKDNLTALIHMVVEAAFWFHPLVWWMERRMVEERERSCDEAVVEMGSRPGIYAESLLKACRFCVESPLVCVSGITGADLSKRVLSIMTLRLERMGMAKIVALALFGIIVIATPILLGQSEAAQRVMLAAANAAPIPFRTAVHAMIAEEQTPSTGEIAEVQPAAQDAATPAFLAADVHPSPARLRGFMHGGMSHGNLYFMRDATVVDLIARSYNVDPSSIFGGPAWLAFDRFDIVGKTPEATTDATAQLMVRSLLADRFKLLANTGTRPLPAFVLSAGKSPKLKLTATPAEPGSCQFQLPPRDAPLTPTIKFSCRNTTMQAFADFLHQVASPYLTRPVVDATGLKGGYDFDIQWTYQIPKDADGTTIFTAVDKQLGLKLEQKPALLPTVVVSSVNETPTPNAPDLDKILPPPPPQEFEVAVIRPTNPASPGNPAVTRFGINFQGVSVNVQHATLLRLIYESFEIEPGEIKNKPTWLDKDLWDITGKATTDASAGSHIPGMLPTLDMDDVHEMLRSLLADRFKLTTHMENQPTDVYALLAAGPKMKKADPNNHPLCEEGPGPGGKDPRIDNPLLNRLISCQNMTMAALAGQLHNLAGGYIPAPVIDATGLEGAYDFTLSFSKAGDLGRVLTPRSTGDNSGVPSASDPSLGTTSLFDALQKQLGLKLEKRSQVPAPVLVIDHIEEKPTEN
jgi:uncharacterized protein (TIGR03435 family)